MKSRYLSFIPMLALCASAQAFDFGSLKDKLGNIAPAQPAAAPAAVAPTTNNAASALAGFSNKDQVGSLKQALTQGAETAVANLAKENGYLGNDKVRIPLPESLQKADSLMRQFGMGKYADELITSMNRAAEAAVPEAKTLLVGAVKNMTVADAKAILTGGNDAATQYFRKNTETALTGKFKPIVNKSMQKVKLAEKYDQFAGKGAQYGLVDQQDAKLDDYITRRAMDGLFLMMAEQEKAIRANPLEATGSLAKKVFSAIKF
ncbi:MAG: DUF4197 domain-containing protein [Gallionella sp.]|nr:DUF4197 domain-containing protein [Gallionella sp.]MDP1940983.1 DUF4197 domain-containing protein [Gallionella sp.]